MGEMKNVYSILVGKPEGKSPLGDPGKDMSVVDGPQRNRVSGKNGFPITERK
jgi:hypothetical protein